MLKRTTLLLSLVLIVVLLALTACGGGAAKPAGGESQPAAAAGGNADNGKKLFNEPVIASAGSPGCVTCHSLEKGKTLVGPSMAGIATVAAADIKKRRLQGHGEDRRRVPEGIDREPGCDGDPGLPARHHAEDLHQVERPGSQRPGGVLDDAEIARKRRSSAVAPAAAELTSAR